MYNGQSQRIWTLTLTLMVKRASKPFAQHTWLQWCTTTSSFKTFCITRVVTMMHNHIKFPNLLYNTHGYDDAQPYQVSKPFVQHTWLWWYATIPSLQTRKVSRKLSALLLSLTRLASQKRWPCIDTRHQDLHWIFACCISGWVSFHRFFIFTLRKTGCWLRLRLFRLTICR